MWLSRSHLDLALLAPFFACSFGQCPDRRLSVRHQNHFLVSCAPQPLSDQMYGVLVNTFVDHTCKDAAWLFICDDKYWQRSFFIILSLFQFSHCRCRFPRGVADIPTQKAIIHADSWDFGWVYSFRTFEVTILSDLAFHAKVTPRTCRKVCQHVSVELCLWNVIWDFLCLGFLVSSETSSGGSPTGGRGPSTTSCGWGPQLPLLRHPHLMARLPQRRLQQALFWLLASQRREHHEWSFPHHDQRCYPHSCWCALGVWWVTKTRLGFSWMELTGSYPGCFSNPLRCCLEQVRETQDNDCPNSTSRSLTSWQNAEIDLVWFTVFNRKLRTIVHCNHTFLLETGVHSFPCYSDHATTWALGFGSGVWVKILFKQRGPGSSVNQNVFTGTGECSYQIWQSAIHGCW